MKRFLLFIAILGFITTANAQYKKYNFGLKAAPQVSWMSSSLDEYESAGVRMGFSWGFIGAYNFTENNSLVSGFNVIFNGGKLRFDADHVVNGTATGLVETVRTYKLKSIEIPISIKMRTNEMNKIHYYAQLGFGTSFLFSAKTEDEFTSNGQVYMEKDSDPQMWKVRESLIIGGGIEYALESGPSLGARLFLNQGFTNILSGKNDALGGLKEKGTISFVELAFSIMF